MATANDGTAAESNVRLYADDPVPAPCCIEPHKNVSRMCDECDDATAAKHAAVCYCTVCRVAMCDFMKQVHKYDKKTRDHLLLTCTGTAS